MAETLGVRYLILHPGFYIEPNKGEGFNRLVEGLNVVLEKTRKTAVKLLIENMAGQGTAIGSTFEDIAYIFKHIKYPKRLGVCLDTAHLLISGYDARTRLGYDWVFSLFDQLVGQKKIKVIHLNDSRTKLSSRNDRHAAIGEGELGLWFFSKILMDKKFLGIPKILEIPDRDQKSKMDLQLLRILEKGHRIARLPDDKLTRPFLDKFRTRR